MSSNAKRELIEGQPALLVIDLQKGGLLPDEVAGIPHMPGYVERLARSRALIDTVKCRQLLGKMVKNPLLVHFFSPLSQA